MVERPNIFGTVLNLPGPSARLLSIQKAQKVGERDANRLITGSIVRRLVNERSRGDCAGCEFDPEKTTRKRSAGTRRTSATEQRRKRYGDAGQLRADVPEQLIPRLVVSPVSVALVI